tara:strand:+ start:136 stop:633 length:498 start_codon:yes stop_codon:yes gene_type:complete
MLLSISLPHARLNFSYAKGIPLQRAAVCSDVSMNCEETTIEAGEGDEGQGYEGQGEGEDDQLRDSVPNEGAETVVFQQGGLHSDNGWDDDAAAGEGWDEDTDDEVFDSMRIKANSKQHHTVKLKLARPYPVVKLKLSKKRCWQCGVYVPQRANYCSDITCGVWQW